jgi:N-acetylglutamate synthase-like GNAT family acetyltransferase
VIYALREVSSLADWAAMHAIRRATLFAPGRHDDAVVYDDNHPDDRLAANQCFLFWLDDAPIGVARLDRRGEDEGVVRLVAIVPELQGRGHGRAMSDMLDDIARARGMTHLLVNAAHTATDFYHKTGWREFDWDPAELVSIAARCVQMRKALREEW